MRISKQADDDQLKEIRARRMAEMQRQVSRCGGEAALRRSSATPDIVLMDDCDGAQARRGGGAGAMMNPEEQQRREMEEDEARKSILSRLLTPEARLRCKRRPPTPRTPDGSSLSVAAQ